MIDDPRMFPAAADAPPEARALHDLAAAALAAATADRADAIGRAIVERLAERWHARDGVALARVLATSPSPAIHRHLWRALVAIAQAPDTSGGLVASLFALPVVAIVAAEDDARPLDAVLRDPGGLAALAREHGMLGGAQAFAFAPALAAGEAIDVERLPALAARAGTLASGAGGAALDVAPAPMSATAGRESVYLRFLVGAALAAPGTALPATHKVGSWGIPLAQQLSRDLAAPGVSVAALPRAPQSPLAALAAGRASHREAGAALFASNAIRRLRASVGEPSAIVSAHRCADATLHGELRLSLSSPFDPREAEGFRCPLSALDNVADVAKMLVDLVRDCRVDDVRVVPGVHADRDPLTGGRLLFKAETVPASGSLRGEA